MTHWPPGDGEMAGRIRAFDWSATPLGPIAGWPQSLRVAARLLLNTRHPMFIWWGPELIQLYNDAYRDTMGAEKHPAALGHSGRDTWAEIWDVIGPQIAQVMGGGPATWHEDQLVPVTRHGDRQQVWWTYGFSPIDDEAAPDGVGGVLVICRDVTQEHRARTAAIENEARYRAFVTASSDVVYRMSPDWSVMQRLDGAGFLADTPEPRRGWLEDYIHPDDRPAVQAAIGHAIATRSQFELEHRVRRRDGTLAWTLSRAVPILSGGGDIVEWLGAARDITRRKEAEAALRASEARHRLLIESWAQAVWETDPAGAVVVDSPSWRSYTGQTFGEWVGHGWPNAIHPDDRAHAERQWREAIAAQGLVDAEFRLRAPGGGWRWTNVRAAPVLDAGGRVEKWAGMNIDIDARKRAEAALRESEARYRMLFESMDEAYAVIEVLKDQAGGWSDFRFVEVNPAFIGHTSMPWPVGRTATELLGTPNPRWTQLYGQALDGDAPIRLVEDEPTLGRTFDLNVFALDRERNRVAVLFTDVTESERAERALRESEARFRVLAEAAPALIWRNDAAGENLFVNKRFTDYTGKSEGEIQGEAWQALIHPDDAEAYVASYLEAVEGRRAWQNRNRIRRHDGTWRWFENYAQPLFDETGRYTGHVGVSADIDAGVRTEQALRDSEARYQALFSASPVPFMVLAPNPPDFTITAANDAYLAATLTTREGLIGRRLFDVFTDDRTRPGLHGLKALALSLDQVLMSRRTDKMERVRYDLVVPGGYEPHWWEAVNAPMLDASGEVTAIIHQVARMTEMHLTEEAEREERERQVFLLRFSDTIRAHTDPDVIGALATHMVGEYMRVDRCYIVQFSREEGRGWIGSEHRLPGLPPLSGEYRFSDFPEGMKRLETGPLIIRDLLNDPSLSETDKTSMDKALGLHGMIAAVLRRGERNYVWCLTAATTEPRDWTDGDLKFLEIVAERIWAAIERARAEAALQESEARFSQFAASSSDALWIRDAATLEMEYVSPAIEPIYGVPPETLLDGTGNWTALILPEDRGTALEHLEQARAGGAIVHEFRIRRPDDGSLRWIRNTDFPLRDAHGRVQRIGGIAQDVTEARRAAERQDVLVAELQHRTRNLIAVVKGIASDTMRETGPTRAFQAAFSDRLSALSRVQGLLSRSEAEPITFGSLLRLELDALGAGAAGDRVTAAGPEVFLRPSTVQTLALALHELATNARKHGALSHDGGRLAVSWRKRSEDGERRLAIEWVETGLEQAPDRPPSVEKAGGYGRELIEQALPHALGARTSYALSASGVRCSIDLAVRSGKGEP